MDQGLLAVVRDLGTVGILGLSLLLIVRAIAPLVTMIADAQKQQADARREQTEASKAVLRRWEESDGILDRNSKEHIRALQAVTDELRDLKVTDTQRIQQNDIVHAQIRDVREDVRRLPETFKAGKDDAVNKVNQAMDDKLKPIEATLQAIQQQVTEALQLLHSVTADRAQASPPIEVDAGVTAESPDTSDKDTDDA